MNKLLVFVLMLLLILSFSGCSNEIERFASTETLTQSSSADSETSEDENIIADSQSSESTSENILIAYFGRWGNTNFDENIDISTSASIVMGKDGNLLGATEYVADLIRQETGGQLHLIQTEQPYPANYDRVVNQNHQEQEEGYIPELRSSVENMEQYDTIFIGYPMWGTTLPRAVVAFLSEYDMRGKTIITFFTHMGYGSGDSYEVIQELCPQATVLEGVAVKEDQIDFAEQKVAEWMVNLQIYTP